MTHETGRSGFCVRPALIALGFAEPYIFVTFPHFWPPRPSAATIPEHV